MRSNQLTILILMFFIMTFNTFSSHASTPCSDGTLLELTDRGSVSDTPCVLPANALLIESGYQYKQFTDFGSQQTFPQSVLFWGLPAKSELIVTLPTYNQLSIEPFSGASATSVGVKHQFNHGQHWVAAGELVLTPAGGSEAFGNQGVGVLASGTMNYDLSEKTSFTFMVEWNSSTLPRLFGGDRFNSVNPSLSLAYDPIESLSFFIEVFAQTKTAPGLGGNYNADCGLLYLLTPNIALDFEVGQQLGHEMASFNQFVGGGVSIKL